MVAGRLHIRMKVVSLDSLTERHRLSPLFDAGIDTEEARARTIAAVAESSVKSFDKLNVDEPYEFNSLERAHEDEAVFEEQKLGVAQGRGVGRQRKECTRSSRR